MPQLPHIKRTTHAASLLVLVAACSMMGSLLCTTFVQLRSSLNTSPARFAVSHAGAVQTYAMVPAGQNRIQTLTARRFFGGDDKKQVAKGKGKEEPGFLQKIGNAVMGLFGGGDKIEKRKESEPAPLFDSSGGGFGIFSALLQPALGLFGNLMKDSRDDTQAVLSEAQTILTRSGELGSRVQCGPIFSQSYSSMNINGRQSKQVQLQFQAKGDSKSGMVTCSASIGDKGVTFNSLSLDGRNLDASGGPSGNVIDVETV
eukprot:CAMPEP_0181411356 /NCGR_PEP_ID=MMETSP1110-20121109/7833_1 /TAXON_ID=174948 /ORGANISM="Symbiodinium sp., Strain CCMP421" /LENGTH=257 /DNA_ID=CAMNT_0023533973 /DNA_START=42 /DNA_END=815 /DNA_ORIENTATION=+